jgi:SAM domain (Sterile alpha motif)
MQQIADWLKKLGMAEYAERFAQNKIDISVLPDLTAGGMSFLSLRHWVLTPKPRVSSRLEDWTAIFRKSWRP